MKTLLFVLFFSPLLAGVYNPDADANADIKTAVNRAKKEGKHVLIQVGGNWCPWCLKMEKFFSNDPDLKKELDDNFVYIFVNYSKENKNPKVFEQLGFPQRFGFPVLVVLNQEGERIHTQNTVFLEKKKSYSKEKVLAFFKHWSPSALDSKKYQ